MFGEAVRVLAASVLAWAQVPVGDELPVRAAQLATVVDGFATPGQPYAEAVRARVQLGRGPGAPGPQRGAAPGPGQRAVRGRDGPRRAQGGRLPARVAGVELLNLVRPTVAAAWFVAFAGQALAQHPAWRERWPVEDRRITGAGSTWL